MDYLGGKSYGIDPYLLEFALESDVDDEIKPFLEEFLKSVDFIHMYEEVLRTKTSLNLDNSVEIIRKPSWEAVIELKRKKIAIDMLHIDGNHDTEIVQKDVDLYFPLVSNGGIIILR